MIFDKKHAPAYTYIVQKKIPNTDYVLNSEVFANEPGQIHLWYGHGNPRVYKIANANLLVVKGFLKLKEKNPLNFEDQFEPDEFEGIAEEEYAL